MKIVEIYSRPGCGYGDRAKRLLARKGIAFTEFDIWAAPAIRSEMARRTNGGRTTPQIIIGGVHVGGCDDLHALDRSGDLDALLAA